MATATPCREVVAAHRPSVVRESWRQLAGRASMLSHASCSCFVLVAERARLRRSETHAPLDQGRQDRRTGGPRPRPFGKGIGGNEGGRPGPGGGGGGGGRPPPAGP